MGPALLWLPFFLVGLALDRLLGGGPLTGFSMWCQWPVYVGSGVYGLLGLWLVYRHVLTGYRASLRLLAISLVVAGTNLNYYLLFAGHMSHGLSFFAIALHLTCLRQLAADPRATWRWVLGGATLGLAAIVRWQDVVIVLLPLAVCGSLAPRLRGQAALGFGCAALGAAPAVTVQLLTWKALYGRPFLVPQGGGFMCWGHPHWAGVLLSDPKGLLFNSPLAALGVVGLVQLWRRDRPWSAGGLAVLGAAVYVCAASSQWDAGESFGMRRLAMTLPLVALGLCEFASRLPAGRGRILAASAIAAGVAWNWVLLAGYFLDRLRNP
jgi:hypothetical protein